MKSKKSKGTRELETMPEENVCPENKVYAGAQQRKRKTKNKKVVNVRWSGNTTSGSCCILRSSERIKARRDKQDKRRKPFDKAHPSLFSRSLGRDFDGLDFFWSRIDGGALCVKGSA